MAVFRIEITKDYTVMANHHLRNTALSLKAKGLLSLMLSLPDDWDYTTKGLARICRDGVDSICSAIKELETQGYIIRHRIRNEKGQLTTVEYTILEKPEPKPATVASPLPKQENPVLDKKPKWENPVLGNPVREEPVLENPNQLNTNVSSKEISNPILSSAAKTESQTADTTGLDTRNIYRAIILENIDYDILLQDLPLHHDQVDEIVELLLDTLCSARKTIRISGNDFPTEIVKARLLKLDGGHIRYVLDCMSNNTTYVRNIKQYLLAALFNAPATISNYYTSLVNHDMYGGGIRI